MHVQKLAFLNADHHAFVCFLKKLSKTITKNEKIHDKTYLICLLQKLILVLVYTLTLVFVPMLCSMQKPDQFTDHYLYSKGNVVTVKATLPSKHFPVSQMAL